MPVPLGQLATGVSSLGGIKKEQGRVLFLFRHSWPATPPLPRGLGLRGAAGAATGTEKRLRLYGPYRRRSRRDGEVSRPSSGATAVKHRPGVTAVPSVHVRGFVVRDHTSYDAAAALPGSPVSWGGDLCAADRTARHGASLGIGLFGWPSYRRGTLQTQRHLDPIPRRLSATAVAAAPAVPPTPTPCRRIKCGAGCARGQSVNKLSEPGAPRDVGRLV